VKSNKRSQTVLLPSFPATAPKGDDLGNEKIIITGQGMRITMDLPKGFYGTATKLFHGILNYTSSSVPFIAQARFSRDRDGKTATSFHCLKLSKLRTKSKKAGMAIMRRYFANFYKVAEEKPTSIHEWRKALALDCVSIFKNPAELEEVKIGTEKEWKAFLKAMRKNRKTDELDYLLANHYEKEGWNKLPLAQVGKIVAKALKRKKPVPTTTLNRRLADLGFASLPVGRPETKYK